MVQAGLDLKEEIMREIHRQESILLEERERKRRVQSPTEITPEMSDAHEAVQQEFMSQVHRKEASHAEEAERQRRIEEVLLQEAIQSEIDRRVTWILEGERNS